MGLSVLLILALFMKSGLLLLALLLLGAAALVAIQWGQHALDRIEYHRQFDRVRCFPGEEVELRVELTNRKVLPVTYLTVDDQVPDELEIHSRKLTFIRRGKGLLRLVFGMAWYQKVIRHYRVTATRRGVYSLGPVRVTGGDPFGFVQHDIELDERAELVVYPRIVPLEQLGIPSRRPFGDLRSRDRLFEDPLRFAGVRDYQPGDPLSRIHWKASAATGRLAVKLLDPSSHLGVAVFINTWGWELFWMGSEQDAIEAACTTAASVVQWAMDEGVPVGLYANGFVTGWGGRLRLPPARGPQVLPHALEGLARLFAPSRTPVADILAEESRGLAYGTSVVVITRQVLDGTADELMRIHRSGRPVTLILVGEQKVAIPALPGISIYEVPREEALHAAALA